MKTIKINENDIVNIIKKTVKEIYDKKQQMKKDWEEYEYNNMLDKKYFDQKQEDNYSKDANTNVIDYHKEKEKYPF
jgi:hypothetical protein